MFVARVRALEARFWAPWAILQRKFLHDCLLVIKSKQGGFLALDLCYNMGYSDLKKQLSPKSYLQNTGSGTGPVLKTPK